MSAMHTGLTLDRRFPLFLSLSVPVVMFGVFLFLGFEGKDRSLPFRPPG